MAFHIMGMGTGVGTRTAGTGTRTMGTGWGHNLRGWGGDGDRHNWDGWGWGQVLVPMQLSISHRDRHTGSTTHNSIDLAASVDGICFKAENCFCLITDILQYKI